MGLAHRSCEERKGQELMKKDQSPTIRSALIFLSSVVPIVAQELFDWTTGGERAKDGRCGEGGGGGSGHGLSDRSGIEDVGDRYGALALLLVGVLRACEVAVGFES